MRANIPLSQLVANRFNPRRVKPSRDAHRRLVASIRAYGLLQPLIIRAIEGESDKFRVMAGDRRLAALREIHRDDDYKADCKIVKEGDPEAIALAENFPREPMHPLDEAESFARQIRDEDKDVAIVATNFGVPVTYIRQRMKLSTLADPIKVAYREDRINTGMAEAFAAVPETKQMDVWKELGGKPHSADQIRNIISNAWVDAKNALYDISTLPPEKMSSDLFGERVLVEREAFLASQSTALTALQTSLKEEGWSEVVIANQGDIQDRLWRMREAPVVYDEKITKRLEKLQEKRDVLEAKFLTISDDDEVAGQAMQEKLDAVDVEEEELTKCATVEYPEPVKAVGTVFLILDPDGQLRREYRVAKKGSATEEGDPASSAAPTPPTVNDLSDKQKATIYTTQALMVRQALLESTLARKRVLALILHKEVHGEALDISHGTNSTTVHAEQSDGFASPVLDFLHAKRAEVEPFPERTYVEDQAAYQSIIALSEVQLDALIAVLTVECVTAYLVRPTKLIFILTHELTVDLRKQWRANAAWLESYQKLQLAELVGLLLGPVHSVSAEKKKKSELVEQLAGLFTAAAEGTLSDASLAQRVNEWLPAEIITAMKDAEIKQPEEAEQDGIEKQRRASASRKKSKAKHRKKKSK